MRSLSSGVRGTRLFLLAGCLAGIPLTAGCFVSESAPTPQAGGTPPGRLLVAPTAKPLAPTEEADDTSKVVQAAGTQDAKTREALFKNWPKPKAALVFTGQQLGYLEPCGCTGLANQKGGLARRHTLLKQLKSDGWEAVPLDAGNQVRRFGRQAEIQFQMTAEALQKMGYRGVALGPDDLRLSVGELVSATSSANGQKTPFASANVTILDPELTPRFQVFTAGGLKFGVTTILGTEEKKRLPADDVGWEPPLAALAKVLPKLKAEKCDVYVLLAHASLEESKAVGAKFPDFDVVVTSGGAAEPALQPEKIASSKSLLIQVGNKGMYAGVLGFFDGPGPTLRYQRVPLDDRYADSPQMLALMASYQEQLKTAGLEGLGVKALPHASGRKFVGSQVCGECHGKAYAVWKETPHAHATDSLIEPSERSEIARHFDPECLSCHVTGWNAQKFYPYKSGYLSAADKLLFGNGCENCHGPGSAHVAAQKGDVKVSDAALKMLQAEMRLPLAEAEKRCMDCHDLDNSPDFHAKGAFEKYWKDIEHKGKD